MAAYDEIRRLKDQLQADNVYLQEEIKLKCNFGEIVGQTPAIRQGAAPGGAGGRHVRHGAPARRDRHGQGTPGPRHSQRQPAASPAHADVQRRRPAGHLIESELFGHEKGAYTGALTRQIGRFEQADGSTLFLDEIGELPLEVQVKLLRVLQYGQFERLGSTRTLSANVRIIAASNRDLETMVKEGRFREDLFYRLNVFPIRLPPLAGAARRHSLLAWSFVREFGRTMGRKIDSIPRATEDTLKRYPWPGNIRELRNVIERAMIVTQGPTLQVEVPSLSGGTIFTPAIRPGAMPPANGLTLDESQRRQILAVLEKTGWRVSGKNGAAAILGLKPTTLESRMAKLGIKRATLNRV